MSLLRIYNKNNPAEFKEVHTEEEIRNSLSKTNIEFQRWKHLSELTDRTDLSNEELLKLYQSEVETIKDLYSFQSVDIINLNPEFSQTEQFEPMRKKFLDEHIHTEYEVRYFIDGQGLFYIHHGDQVFGMLCTAGDFISVPPNTKHWFDMGSEPNFKCIRFFTSEEGWVPVYQENSLSDQFHLLDEFLEVSV